jgi:hypothetical protein
MTAAVAVLMAVPWHRQLSCACLPNNDNDNGGYGMNDSALALFAIPAHLLNDNIGSGGGASDRCLGIDGCPLLTHAMAVAAAVAQTILTWDFWLSLAHSHDGNN